LISSCTQKEQEQQAATVAAATPTEEPMTGDRSVYSQGGKSGHQRAGWSLTGTGGNPKESATEKTPPRRKAG